MGMKLNIAVVVQRFGKEVVGGAETHAKLLIEQLTNELKWQVTVYTTTAKNYSTWAPHFAPGRTEENNISILRFDVDQNRSPLFGIYNKLYKILFHLPIPKKIKILLENLWMYLQGPNSKLLEKQIFLDQSKYRLILFFTYLYPTTNQILPKISVPTVLIPTAHNELAFYFNTTKILFENASYIYANTNVEKNLITEHYPSVLKKTKVVGLGFDQKRQTPPNQKSRQKPYLLYLGRIGRSKNVHTLAKYFSEFLSANPTSELELVLAGEYDDGFHLSHHKNVTSLGYISDSDKDELLTNAVALVSASYFESLAMIVLEAIAVKTPVIAAEQCPLFREYAATLSSVHSYRNSAEFSTVLEDVTSRRHTADLASAAESSLKWLKEHLAWHKVLTKYKSLEQDCSSKGELN